MNLPEIAGWCIGIAAGITLLGVGWQVASARRSDDVAPGADVATSLAGLQHKRQHQEKTEKSQLESRSALDATVRP